MKHIKSRNDFVNEASVGYHRTIGFRYSDPNDGFSVSCYYVGDITVEEVESILESVDVKFKNVEVGTEKGTISTKVEEGEGEEVKEVEEEVKVDGQIKFDIFVYSEKEIEKILDDVVKETWVDYNVRLVDVIFREHKHEHKRK